MRVVSISLLFAVAMNTSAEWTHDADRCARIANDHELAIHHCTLAIESGKLGREDLAQTYSNRSYEYSAVSNTDRALEDSLHAVQLDDLNPLLWNQLGRVYGDMNRCYEAIGARKKALQRASEEHGEITVGDSMELTANLGIAWCYDRLGDRDNARTFLIRTFNLEPDFAPAQSLYRDYGLR